MTSPFTQQELDEILGTLLEVAKRNQNAAIHAVEQMNQAANALMQSASNLPSEVTKSVHEAINGAEQRVIEFSKAQTQFLHQERIDAAVKTAMPLDVDDLEFLKNRADTLDISVELIYSNGNWWLKNDLGTSDLVTAVLTNRAAQVTADQPE